MDLLLPTPTSDPVPLAWACQCDVTAKQTIRSIYPSTWKGWDRRCTTVKQVIGSYLSAWFWNASDLTEFLGRCVSLHPGAVFGVGI